MKKILLTILSLCLSQVMWAQDYTKDVEKLLKKMTLEEKVGQMTQFTSSSDVTGPTLRGNVEKDVKAGHVGSLFNAVSADYTRKLQKMAVEETRLGIPLLFGYDVIHGFKTIFPIPLGEASSFDLELMQDAARVAAEEASAAGIHWTFAPMVDVSRDPRWGRVMEGAGEDTYYNSEVAKARVKGFQGDDLAATNTVLACAKHFLAYGAPQGGRDYHTVDMSLQTLHDVYLPPFKACVDAGVETFMTSFNEINGTPSTANPYLFKDILRDQWDFEGVVVTDYTAINELIPHGIAGDLPTAGQLALNAGIDMDMEGDVFLSTLVQSVKDGKVSEKDIDHAVRRILLVKFKLGLFDDPYRYCDAEREKSVTLSQDFKNRARKAAQRSIVLLKNENQILPLTLNNTKKIALIGPLAKSKKDVLGGWKAKGSPKQAKSLFEGMKAATKDKAELLYAKGCKMSGADTTGFAEALEVAQQSDVVVLAIGEPRTISGEAKSRSDINIPGVQTELLAHLKQAGKPIVVVLMNGRPLTLEREDELADALLETWHLGTMAGPAIADVIFGKYNPSGKLPMSFPRNVGQIPIFYNAKNTGRPFDPEKPSGYKSNYLDVPNTPLYAFGYGLSYTEFAYGDIKLSAETMEDQPITASIEVTNTGDYDGEEVVQLYIQDLIGKSTRPLKEMKGFEKIFLKKGETKTVTFTIAKEALTYHRWDMSEGVEAGDFNVYIGTSSDNVKQASFKLTKDFEASKQYNPIKSK
ncbi:glycoside hydrolase family 3 C-terminal domain-containing protein [Flammeovirga yaeyamensis]|uniref:Periplasmic beta-glucosidase n=1 Tax=Flammeovirga yaeyamensis TaxID=367791 RepID=A0AAX1NFJ5_9BACT|nr:glycoside hydrolase family 3 N-terminal domain-containing protein [Flammeovirga yaeyamensis]MBB3697084.1 beta-glucosidase [Flammeovirga yaeyamensis]NMF33746.1 glycosyl hydrolase [Flammeovirga yaeyamensis]QWG04988.1 glycoside hydrolase family 3 C-terminal domain-containing protein [Flammeovirga yaeyamensis]